MVTMKAYDLKTKKIEDIKVDAGVFGHPENDELIQFAITIYRNKARSRNAAVKTRAEVSGGGRKPWKQKGTGRARAGTSRSPLWVGGGVMMGPTNVERSIKINRKVARKALLTALSSKVEKSIVLKNDTFFSETISNVKSFVELKNNISLSSKKVLYISKNVSEKEKVIGNVEGLIFNSVHGLNVFDLANNDCVLIEETALKQIEEMYKNA